MSSDSPSKDAGKGESACASLTNGANVTLSAVQEEVRVGVTEAETGAVRVRKVVSDETRPVSLELRRRTVDVTRVSVNRPVEAEFGPRQEGDTLIVPVFEYVPIVTMQLTLKEEVHITTRTVKETELRHVEVSTEKVVVERRVGADGAWVSEDSTEG
jgi:stress response protein YsnF